MRPQKQKKPILIVGIILLLASLADIKYKGLFYKTLPKTMQDKLDRLFNQPNG